MVQAVCSAILQTVYGTGAHFYVHIPFQILMRSKTMTHTCCMTTCPGLMSQYDAAPGQAGLH